MRGWRDIAYKACTCLLVMPEDVKYRSKNYERCDKDVKYRSTLVFWEKVERTKIDLWKKVVVWRGLGLRLLASLLPSSERDGSVRAGKCWSCFGDWREGHGRRKIVLWVMQSGTIGILIYWMGTIPTIEMGL